MKDLVPQELLQLDLKSCVSLINENLRNMVGFLFVTQNMGLSYTHQKRNSSELGEFISEPSTLI